MKTVKILLIVIISLIVISGIVFCISQNNNSGENEIISDGFNLKIAMDYNTTPVKIITYYFYNDYVIKTNYTGGVLPSGPVTTTETTKYYFDNEIDLTELNNYIERSPKGTSKKNIAEITKSNGKICYINNPGDNASDFMKQVDLISEIEKITNKAIKEEVKK